MHLEGAPKGGVWLAGSLVLMLVCGLIVRAVVNQSLPACRMDELVRPER